MPGRVRVLGKFGWKPATKTIGGVKTLTPRKRMADGQEFTDDTPHKIKKTGKGVEYI